jgi:uncharacterized protein (UPF0333 family)
MKRSERRKISLLVFVVLVAIVIIATYSISSGVTPDEMNNIEGKAIDHAKYCMAMNYEPIECK